MSNIGYKSEHHFKAALKFKHGESVSGYLSNWGETCCFVILDKKTGFKRQPVILEFVFEEKTFTQKGLIATGYGPGFGIKFIQDSHEGNRQNWANLYTIIKDRGYNPQNVRTL